MSIIAAEIILPRSTAYLATEMIETIGLLDTLNLRVTGVRCDHQNGKRVTIAVAELDVDGPINSEADARDMMHEVLAGPTQFESFTILRNRCDFEPLEREDVEEYEERMAFLG